MGNVKRSLVLAFLMTLGLPAAVYAMSDAREPGQVFHPQIRETRGPVMVKGARYSIWEPAEEGMLLLSGDVLRTDKGGFARVEFASGVIELYETTVMVIPSIKGTSDRKKDIREVAVEEGNALFDINPLGVERGFEFRTKNVQGGVKGTVFTVSYREGGTSVNVYRGVVQVSDPVGSEDTKADLVAGSAVRVEKRAHFKNVHKFDPSLALEELRIDKLPELDGKGLVSEEYKKRVKKQKEDQVKDKGKGKGKGKGKSKDK